ncbi:MAG: hypothetical protein AAF555_06245 [Verrucomicrobiota bacterium]
MSQSPVDARIQFTCPECQAELAVPMSLAGVEGPCPYCGQPVQAPAPAMAEALSPRKVQVPEGSSLLGATVGVAALPEPEPVELRRRPFRKTRAVLSLVWGLRPLSLGLLALVLLVVTKNYFEERGKLSPEELENWPANNLSDQFATPNESEEPVEGEEEEEPPAETVTDLSP